MFKIYEEKAKSTDDNVWNQLQEHHMIPVHKYINNIDLDYNIPYRYAVVTETEIPIYSCESNTKSINLANVKNASCCKFRSDGDLVLVGTKTGQILLISPKMPGKILHSIQAHSKIITKIEYLYKFDPVQKNSVSISDDGTLQIWDVLTCTRLHLFSHSKEPLRALALSKSNPNIIATGSLDRFIRIYNIEKSDSIFTIINTQIETNCLLFPFSSNANFILSSGKSSIYLWDVSGPMQDVASIPIKSSTPHHMLITDMCVSDGLCTGERVIFTASLDGTVKVTALADFQEIGKYKYQASLMSIRVLPDCQGMVVSGNDLSDSTKSWIFTRKFKPITVTKSEQTISTEEDDKNKIQRLTEKYCLPNETINVVPHGGSISKHSKFDKMLKKHKHRAMLTMMLSDPELLNKPDQIQHWFRELVNLGALRRALSQQTDTKLGYLMRYLRVLLSTPEYVSCCVRVLLIVFEQYSVHTLNRLPEFRKLSRALNRSVYKWKRIDQATVGLKEMLFCCESSSLERGLSTTMPPPVSSDVKMEIASPGTSVE